MQEGKRKKTDFLAFEIQTRMTDDYCSGSKQGEWERNPEAVNALRKVL